MAYAGLTSLESVRSSVEEEMTGEGKLTVALLDSELRRQSVSISALD